MEMTLRKAAKVRSKLEELVNELRTELSNREIRLHVMDTPEKWVENLNVVRDVFRQKYTRLRVLSMVLAELRSQVALGNVAARVHATLAEIAVLEGVLSVMTATEPVDVTLSGGLRCRPRRKRRGASEETLSDEQIVQRITGARAKYENDTTGYHAQDTVSFSFINSEMSSLIDSELATIRRQIDDHHETLEIVNNTFKITVTDEMASVLVQHELI
jgi:hypothetical protein